LLTATTRFTIRRSSRKSPQIRLEVRELRVTDPARPAGTDRHYVRLLHLAASTSESEIETALGLLLEQHAVPTFDVVRDLTRPPADQRVPQLSQPLLDLSVYDQLLTQGAAHA